MKKIPVTHYTAIPVLTGQLAYFHDCDLAGSSCRLIITTTTATTPWESAMYNVVVCVLMSA
jgi:hypothetical protein